MNLIRTYIRLKSITKIPVFSLIGKKKKLTAKIDNFQKFFFHTLDGNKLLYKCAKFPVKLEIPICSAALVKTWQHVLP